MKFSENFMQKYWKPVDRSQFFHEKHEVAIFVFFGNKIYIWTWILELIKNH